MSANTATFSADPKYFTALPSRPNNAPSHAARGLASRQRQCPGHPEMVQRSRGHLAAGIPVLAVIDDRGTVA